MIEVTGVMAQEAILASGMDAIGSGGSVSYSVGQIVYTSEEGSTGSLTQGIQQSYEISIVNGIENEKINLEMYVFPNPTKNNLILTINDIELSNLTFQLFDITGKFLQEKRIVDNRTMIDLTIYLSGIYFVKILNENLELKNYKIIKN
jgi:hypothetical protein